MSGNKVLLDTNVILLISKKLIDPRKLARLYDEFFVSIVTYMEAYGFDFPNPDERKRIDLFFDNVEVVPLNMAIAEQVILYKRQKRKKIKLPDAIILATAKYLGATLLSEDWDDFSGIDDEVVIQDLSAIKR